MYTGSHRENLASLATEEDELLGGPESSSHSQHANVAIDQNGNTVLEKALGAPVSPALWLEFVILEGSQPP